MESVFIFRRDLRIHDNTGLLWALRESDRVHCVFFLDPRQVQDHPYRSVNALQFMRESLRELAEELSLVDGVLNLVAAQADEGLRKVLSEVDTKRVYVNEDYTPFSKMRDAQLRKVCKEQGAELVSCQDLLLTVPGSVRTNNGDMYQVYSSFYRKAIQLSVPKPVDAPCTGFASEALKCAGDTLKLLDGLLGKDNPHIYRKGGRKEALTVLDRIADFAAYVDTRNIPWDDDGTTGLSAHHKFGTISVRETFHAVANALGADHHLIKELYWRDFFTHIAQFYPEVFGNNFNSKYDAVKWDEDPDALKAWQQGRTGFPIVDAGMRQLVATGYMHNRVRMIVASFLTKDLHINWQEGERFFARHLIDYDPSVNNGNWQWAGSTGVDAQPYFRIFNPWSQQQRYDKECEYIKKWIPELRSLSTKAIHKLAELRPLDDIDYPAPIVDHASEREETLARFKSV